MQPSEENELTATIQFLNFPCSLSSTMSEKLPTLEELVMEFKRYDEIEETNRAEENLRLSLQSIGRVPSSQLPPARHPTPPPADARLLDSMRRI